MSTPSTNAWIYAVAAVFFLGVGLRDLGLGGDPDLLDAAWELTFATANGLFVWLHRGGPAWTKPIGTALFAAGIAGALASIVLDAA
ncbi:hypothetical protein [Rubrivirga sp.]|uniref:hypothetical protein n=1 Tax=Rubrivirga sp. TaxID=1885344 RepID=UPI003B51C39C